MSITDFVKTYVPRAFVATVVYCITVTIFLFKENYSSIWILFLGNVLFMLSVSVITYLSYRASAFKTSPIGSAVSGHIISLTGSGLSVIVSLLLYFLFDFAIRKQSGEIMQNVPGNFPTTQAHGMLFVIALNAAFGNTVAGFFGALFTSFDTSKQTNS